MAGRPLETSHNNAAQPSSAEDLATKWASVHLRPDANDFGGATLALLPPNPELANAEDE